MRAPLRIGKDGKLIITEAIVKTHIRNYLKQVPGLVYWHNLQGLGCYQGLPDYEGVYLGKHFYIEAKSPKGSQRPMQTAFQIMVETQGETYILADNVEVVMEKLPIRR